MSSHTTNQIERNIAGIDVRNLFKEENKDNVIKDRILREVRILFESDEKDYYKTIRIGNAFRNNYVEYESNADKGKMISIEEYLDKIRPYLSDITNYYETQGKWKIQLTALNNMHSKNNNIEIMQGIETDENIDGLFKPLLQKY